LQAVQKKEISSESSIGKLTPPTKQHSPQEHIISDQQPSKPDDEQPQPSLSADPHTGKFKFSPDQLGIFKSKLPRWGSRPNRRVFNSKSIQIVGTV